MAENFKVYGNESIKKAFHRSILSGKLSHAFIFYGEKGLGKKTLARYAAMQILCEEKMGTPCGVCNTCRKILHSAHPDVITVSPSGQNGRYLVKDFRPLVTDAYILPNDGEKKIYIIPDFDSTLKEAQNVLLKIIEEPPQQTVFIFTAENKNSFLPTILSRAISFPIQRVSDKDCTEALLESKKFTDAQIKDSVLNFGGNIGKCFEYLEDEGISELVSFARTVANAITKKDEYLLCKTLSSMEKNRKGLRQGLSFLSEIIRDAYTVKLGGTLISCGKLEAKVLSDSTSSKRLENMFDIIDKHIKMIDGNGGLPITLSSLCANLKIATL